MSTQQAQPATSTLPTSNAPGTTTPPILTVPLTSSPTSSIPIAAVLPTSAPPRAPIVPASNTLFTLSEKREFIDSAILQNGSVLSGLLAAVAAQLLTFFKDDSNFAEDGQQYRGGILQLTYISLLNSILATTSALALTVASIDIHKRGYSLVRFMRWVFALWVASLVVVTASTVASIVLYVSVNEGYATTIGVYFFAALVGLLLVWLTFETAIVFTTETWRRRRDKWKAARGY